MAADGTHTATARGSILPYRAAAGAQRPRTRARWMSTRISTSGRQVEAIAADAAPAGAGPAAGASTGSVMVNRKRCTVAMRPARGGGNQLRTMRPSRSSDR